MVLFLVTNSYPTTSELLVYPQQVELGLGVNALNILAGNFQLRNLPSGLLFFFIIETHPRMRFREGGTTLFLKDFL